MKTIKDLDINNKRVIIRFDYNVPIKDGVILDDTIIVKSLKTLNYARKCASKVIILSHLGRIKTIDDKEKNSLRVVCDHLSELINEKVAFSTYDDAKEVIENNDIIMMENTRFFDLDNNKESNENEELSKYFASFGDIFVNEAFSCSHRECSSITGISKILPSVNGFQVCIEIDNLSKLLNDYEKPYTICLGGKKVSDKIGLIDNLINKVDYILVSGLMAYTFLKAKGYNTGNNFVEEEKIDYCKELLDKYSDKIILSVDAYTSNKEYKLVSELNDNDECLDIGEKTVDLFKTYLEKSKTIFINGPFGLFENDDFSKGSKSMCEVFKSLNSSIYAGGGETTYMLNKFNVGNVFMSTGGGATLTYLSTGKLIGIIE